MLIKRTIPESCNSKAIRTYTTTYIWSTDGWVYDITARTRRQFLTTSKRDTFEMIHEKCPYMVIPGVEYQEDIEVAILSEKPLIWRETHEDFVEEYASLSSISK